jgi:hypothetical protein
MCLGNVIYGIQCLFFFPLIVFGGVVAFFVAVFSIKANFVSTKEGIVILCTSKTMRVTQIDCSQVYTKETNKNNYN